MKYLRDTENGCQLRYFKQKYYTFYYVFYRLQFLGEILLLFLYLSLALFEILSIFRKYLDLHRLLKKNITVVFEYFQIAFGTFEERPYICFGKVFVENIY